MKQFIINAEEVSLGDLPLATQEYVNNKDEVIESIAKGANQALSYADYQALIDAFNLLDIDSVENYKVGQNIMIVTLNVPDLWISAISDTYLYYSYLTDESFVDQLKAEGSIQIGYYVFSALETQKVDLTGYVEKEEGKGLSEANFTVGEKAKLAGISSTITGVDTKLWNITNTGTIKVGPGHIIPDTISHAAVFGYYNTLEEGAWRTLVSGANNKLGSISGLSIVGGKDNVLDCKNVTSGASASLIAGQQNKVNGICNIVAGYKNKLGYIGDEANTVLSVNQAAVFGTEQTIEGGAWRVLVGGAFNTVTEPGALSLVQGHTNASHGRASLIVGENNVSNADYSTCLGAFNTSNREGQVVTGICAQPSVNSVLTVGNGSYIEHTDSSGNVTSIETLHSNAFEVISNEEGKVSLKVGSVEITEEQLTALLALLNTPNAEEGVY